MSRSSARPKLVEPDGFDSPARAELALAIAARAGADEVLQRLEDAAPELRSGQSRRAGALERAKETLANAAQVSARHLLGQVTGKDAGQAPLTPREAREAVQDAEDALAEATAAAAGIDGQLNGARLAARSAADRVHAFAASVMREHPTIADAQRNLKRLQRELLIAGGTFSWLVGQQIVQTLEDGRGSYLRTPEATEARWAVHQLMNPPRLWDDVLDDLNEANADLSEIGAARWAHVFEALQRDAHAPISEVL